MENEEKCVENGKSDDTMEQQSEVQNIMEHDELDNNVFDFDSHFDGNELGSGDEFDDTERSFQIG